MKMTQLTAALSLGLLISPSLVQAQTQTCNATVSKRTVTEATNRESAWEIIFDIAAPSCDNSRGQFTFVVQLDASGRTELANETGEFATSNGKPTAVRFTYQAKPGRAVTNVTGASIKNCTCVAPGK
jgi:hypothetical protein